MRMLRHKWILFVGDQYKHEITFSFYIQFRIERKTVMNKYTISYKRRYKLNTILAASILMRLRIKPWWETTDAIILVNTF
jgi:hypothetical protein